MIGGIGMPELIIILVIILIIFGAGKLPEIGAGLGKGIKNFKKATKEVPPGEKTDKLEDASTPQIDQNKTDEEETGEAKPEKDKTEKK
jgi:sec-independent protein translocase protein TatA